jgi:hypothetical protein
MSWLLLNFGAAAMVVWAGNMIWIFSQIVKHTPNWRSDKVDADTMIQNFVTNTPIEHMARIQAVAQTNSFVGFTGLALLILASIL